LVENADVLKVFQEVLVREKPSKKRYKEVLSLAERMVKKVKNKLKKFGLEGEVEVEGSVAKDTWLKDEVDIDIFILIPEWVEENKLRTVYLETAKESVRGFKWIERYAEHPYIEAIINGNIKVNIVPCFKVKPLNWKTAADRTPYHTEYVKNKLKDELKDEVRVLKRFMKGIEVYGADIKTGGFSGYLAELLILNYGGFPETIKKVAGWKIGEFIDVEGYYTGKIEDAKKFFESFFIVVDPVDKFRNVAAAVRLEAFNIFRSAAKFFLKKPSLNFFYPPLIQPPPPKKLVKNFSSRGGNLLFLVAGKINAVPDVLWGQLYKSKRAVENLLKQFDFKVLRSSCWSNEKNLSILIFELEKVFLENVKKHYGPPVGSKEEEKFLDKYVNSEVTVAGPYIEGERWIVHVKRRYTDARSLLEDRLKIDGGRSFGVADKVAKAFKSSFKIYLDGEVLKIYRENRDFASFLTKFISGRPFWLE